MDSLIGASVRKIRRYFSLHLPSLVLGDGGGLETRMETVIVPELTRRVRVAWISDVHLRRRATIRTVRAVVLAVRALRPDVIVLGGDLVDGEEGMRLLELLVRALLRMAPVWALPGNHDESFGSGRVGAAVGRAGGAWLCGKIAGVAGGQVHLIAGEDGPRTQSIGKILMVCLHNPASARAWDGKARVVVAGHLHGGQIVLAEWGGRSWPCSLIYRWCGPRFELPLGTTLLVGRGAGDQLPIRWRCPREVLAVDLMPESGAGQ